MKFVAFGVEPVGVIAIGQVPLGVVAIGQGARGVIAIGQLACGVIAIGQLAVGILSFGQLALGAGWSGGMLAFSPVGGPALLGFGGVGELGLRDLTHARFNRVRRTPAGTIRLGITSVVAVTALLVLWFGGIAPLIDEFRNPEPDEPRQLR